MSLMFITASAYAQDMIPDITSNTSVFGIASASDSYSANYAAWKAFDDTSDNESHWHTLSGKTGWLAYEFSERQKVTGYSIEPNHYNGVSYAPRDWTFEGWNGNTWVVLDTRTAIGGWVYNEKKTFQCDNTNYYIKYRINVSANGGGNYLSIAELEMFGAIVQSLAEWREQNFGTQEDVGDAANGADPDQDGVVNLVEYALLLDPKIRDINFATFWNSSVYNNPQHSIDYTRRIDALREVRVRGVSAPSPDGPWTYGYEEVWTSDGRMEFVTAHLPHGNDTQRFFKLDVSYFAASDPSSTAVSSSQINLTWADNSHNYHASESGFVIERRQSGTPNFVPVGETTANVTSYQDTGLPAGTKFYYRIAMKFAGQNGAWTTPFTPIAHATTLSN